MKVVIAGTKYVCFSKVTYVNADYVILFTSNDSQITLNVNSTRKNFLQ